ncbi:MAG TPA: SHOCT domain-containing protein [Hymenobacter sp.]|uniref:SHOCT domain-containing protein n=1 Tax=Hymenobacter sp. TaxID=1898978 RepID=UPI002D7F3FD8|nr:SHOCT domain-containing protein [Hymenobacter sp.]HET9505786.1 SHOCT domain-containing protein [Hymenobacter sp.]
MNPSDANSPIATLRQLKEMLDAGALTPQEFEALKQKLIFGAEAATPPAPIAPLAPITPASPAPPAYVAPAASEVSPVPAPETPDWLAAVAPALVDHSTPVAEEEPTYDEGLEKRNPLNLVFAIGGALVFLAVVLYLTLGNRPADEHLTSTTQTAADSARVAPEVGPQAEQLMLPPASPETTRVVPVVPATVAPAASTFRSDSAAVPAPAVAPTTPAKAAAKPVPNTTVATDSAI